MEEPEAGPEECFDSIRRRQIAGVIREREYSGAGEQGERRGLGAAEIVFRLQHRSRDRRTVHHVGE